jgi:diguanylate cyclase (GGDEF)-like protein
MNLTLSVISAALVLMGAGLLAVAMAPVFRLVKRLPHGMMRDRWRLLGILITFFFVGYFLYFIRICNQIGTPDLLVPSIFFFGGLFVLLVNIIALQTTTDMRRVVMLEEESIMDPLLGIYNRRFLERQLDLEIERAQRYDFPVSALMVDIDHFKRVNDVYGHQAGDAVLWDLGALLVSGVRNVDTVARYGGEELVIVAPHTNGRDALIMADRLRRSIEFADFTALQEHVGREELPHITISIGVAELTAGIDSAQALLELSDQALYCAKRDGRNRVVLYEPEVATAET